MRKSWQTNVGSVYKIDKSYDKIGIPSHIEALGFSNVFSNDELEAAIELLTKEKQ